MDGILQSLYHFPTFFIHIWASQEMVKMFAPDL